MLGVNSLLRTQRLTPPPTSPSALALLSQRLSLGETWGGMQNLVSCGFAMQSVARAFKGAGGSVCPHGAEVFPKEGCLIASAFKAPSGQCMQTSAHGW